MTSKNYSGAEHSISFAGFDLNKGLAPDTFMTVAQQNPNFGYTPGLDGEGTWWENKNRYTIVTITTNQTSETNGVLSAILNGDLKVPGGTGIAPFFARDRNGTFVISAAEARILGPPEQARGMEPGTLQWQIGLHQPERFDGGN